MSLDDWGITLATSPAYLAIESKQTLLESAVVAGVERTTKDLPHAPTLVYLANEIRAAGRESIPYSVVAALDPTAKPPLGPFLPPGVVAIRDDEIILADWSDSPLRGLPAGTPLTVTYFEPETHDGKLVESTATFRLAGFVPMQGVAADPHLTPAFPGITDKLSLRDWDPPFPYDNKKLKPRDEKYWREHKATPKAYVTLAAGRKLWASRFGDTTSIRVANVTNLDDFKERLRSNLNPEEGGFVFDDVKGRFDAASQGGQDFGGLFLGFSFFLIADALLLIGLLTRLNLDRRAGEVGLLLATGWRAGRVRWMLLLEGLIVAAIGGLIGLAGAVGYAAAMLKLLVWLWPDASVGSFLKLHVSGLSLAVGYVGALAISAGTVVWALRSIKRASPSALLAGGGSFAPSQLGPPRRRHWPMVLAVVALVAGLG
ncbi:MAG: ABC transporter permease, partial [Gemmataceae bacterium]